MYQFNREAKKNLIKGYIISLMYPEFKYFKLFLIFSKNYSRFSNN